MRTLLAKEVRLLMPAWPAALLLAIVPVWLFGRDTSDPELALFPFSVGVVALALCPFGRELALNTFPLMLSEPINRSRMWWTKVLLLATAMATVFAAWLISCGTWFNSAGRPGLPTHMLVAPATFAAVAFAGGLWTTLLLQQVTAALWFTILIPLAIGAIGSNTISDSLLVVVLGCYSLAGFAFAWWRFGRVEEVGWTGGVISIPRLRSRARHTSVTRVRRPLAALAWKELQLQQIGLVGIAWLFLLHLAVIAVRKFGNLDSGSSVHVGLEVFSGTWLLVPLLISAPMLAEEHKLGTMDALLCLPVSRWLQLALKLLLALVLGGLLPAFLCALAERIGRFAGTPADVEFLRQPFGKLFIGFALPGLALSLVAFYASTLARNVIQAMATGVALVMVIWLALAWAVFSPSQSATPLWAGPLPFYFAVPVLTVTLLWLSARNFQSGSRLLVRNGLGLIGAFVFIGVASAVTFHRSWELLVPVEPAHGPARLDAGNPPRLKSYGGSALVALFPDGTLWADRLAYNPGKLLLAFGERTGFRLGAKWESLDAEHFVPGSNWVDAVAGFQESVGIRADGTLWVSDRPRTNNWNYYDNISKPPPVEEPAPLVRFGTETNWKTVSRGFWEEQASVFLLKQDGSLWHWTWSTNRHTAPGLRFSSPRRLGGESDWNRIMCARGSFYAWKRDGHAYVVHAPGIRELRASEIPLEEGIVLERLPSQDNAHWRSLTDFWPLHVAVRDDGTLWAWDVSPPPNAKNDTGFLAREPVRIGSEADWKEVSGAWGVLAGLKSDGSIWQWRSEPEYARRRVALINEAPTRLGSHNDWLAVGSVFNATISLSADGNLWYWWTQDFSYFDSDQPMLLPSRRPVKIGSIFQ
jgi:ABC-type transport system involved in multi-copper enzyme maturation permease subunit